MYINNENADRAIVMLNEEMGKILAMPELSKDTLCALGEIVDIMKDIKELDKGEGNSYEGGYGRNSMNYSSRFDGYSARRGRSYDTERDHLLSKIEHFMNQASNESERQLVQKIMNSI